MPTEILTVANDKVEEATKRAEARGGTIKKKDKLNGTTKLTIEYPLV